MQTSDSTPLPVTESVTPVQQVHHYYHPTKSGSVAALLEVLPGLFFQTFGIGHIYAGNVGTGLFFMFGYWLLLFFNVLLMFVFIGFITAPLCWVAAMIISSLTAANSCKTR
jgi:TM2 domain-containing membrane protein YozV